MAEKRMFSKKITESDAFLDMPASTQNLYFHLSMNADDEGFVDKAKSIMRMIGARDDDMKVLISKSFVIPFESGVIVIKHWRMNNYLRKDRFTPTAYVEELKQLDVKENGSYTLKNQLGIPNTHQTDTEYSIDKNRLDKNSIDKYSADVQDIFSYWNSFKIIVHREITDKINKAILKALKTYSVNEIKTYIERYNTILKDKDFYFDYKWSLVDFLTQKNAMTDFTDEGSKWNSYISRSNKVETKPTSKKWGSADYYNTNDSEVF